MEHVEQILKKQNGSHTDLGIIKRQTLIVDLQWERKSAHLWKPDVQ